MSRPVRFLHTADIHLGTPVQGFSGAAKHVEERLRQASFLAWERICDAALAHDVDFVLVGGDLYHEEARSIQAVRFLRKQVERLSKAGIGVYVVYGNHDPVNAREDILDMPDNFYAFPATHPGCVEVKDRDGIPLARIIGVSYRTRWDSRRLHALLQPPDATVVNIGLLHTALDPNDSNYAPCSIQDLVDQVPIHYWALGHVHESRIVRSELPAIVYPGTPQGRHIRDGEVGGCFLVELALGKAPDIRFIPIAPLIWKEIEVSIDVSVDGTSGHGELLNITDVEQLLQAKAEEFLVYPQDHIPAPAAPLASGTWSPEGYLVRWVLTGRGPVHELLMDLDNGSAHLEQCLESFQYREPFLWTESIQIETGKVLPEWESMLESWPLVQKLEVVAGNLLTDAAMRPELVRALGEIWDAKYDLEHAKDTTFPATEEVVATIVERAKRLAYEKLLEGGQLP